MNLVGINVDSSGASVRIRGRSVVLDGARGGPSNLRFLSHAHSDHIAGLRPGQRVICSEPTSLLAALRGRILSRTTLKGVRLVPTGHILGSMALSVPGEFLCTGDFNDRDRPFFSGFRPPTAKVLVTEATYGSQEFSFDSERQVVEEAVDKIKELLNLGKRVVILGYPLGKSQHLQMLFDGHLRPFPCYSWPSIERYNEIYRLFGKDKAKKTEVAGKSALDLLDGSGSVVYMPSYSKRIPFYEELRKKGAVSMAFSGWSLLSGYSKGVDADHSFVISDHADFDGLIRSVERASPERVYVTHGLTGELTRALRSRGFDARPLFRTESTISRFLD